MSSSWDLSTVVLKIVVAVKRSLLLLCVLLWFWPLGGWACEHTQTTKKCLKCLRINYQRYGTELAIRSCDTQNCPLVPREKGRQLSNVAHKHCGRHGSVVTMTTECQACVVEEAKEYWREAEIAKQEDKIFKKYKIPLPEYRDHASPEKRAKVIRYLRLKSEKARALIEKYEERMFTPGLTGRAVDRLEKRIHELEFELDLYDRAL